MLFGIFLFLKYFKKPIEELTYFILFARLLFALKNKANVTMTCFGIFLQCFKRIFFISPLFLKTNI